MLTSKVTFAMFAAMACTVIAEPHRIISRDVKSRGEYYRPREAYSYKPEVGHYYKRRSYEGEYEKEIKGKYNKHESVDHHGSYKPQPHKHKSEYHKYTKRDYYAEGKNNYHRKQEPKNKYGHYN